MQRLRGAVCARFEKELVLSESHRGGSTASQSRLRQKNGVVDRLACSKRSSSFPANLNAVIKFHVAHTRFRPLEL